MWEPDVTPRSATCNSRAVQHSVIIISWRVG